MQFLDEEKIIRKLKNNEIDDGRLHHLLLDSIKKSYINLTKFLIEEKGLDVNTRYNEDSLFFTPIVDAILKNDVEMVKTLIKLGANLDSIIYQNTKRISLFELKITSDEMLEIFVENHKIADDYMWETIIEHGKLPLLQKAIFNKELTFRSSYGLFLEKYNIAKKATTAFHFAASAGKLEMMEYLMTFKIDIDSVQELKWYNQIKEEGLFENNKYIFQYTPLRRACENGHLEVVKFLIDKGAKINNGYDLIVAVENNHMKIVELLIEEGFSINNTNRLILKKALKNKNIEILKGFLENDADVEKNLVAVDCTKYDDEFPF